MTTVVELQVAGLDMSDPTVLAKLASVLDCSFSYQGKLTLMAVYVEPGQDVVSTVVEASNKLKHMFQNVGVVRVHPDLVTASEIAARVGVSREAVRLWAEGNRKPFPLPFAVVGSQDQRIWRWVEVTNWLLDVKGIDMDEDQASLADIAQIDACLSQVVDAVAQEWHSIGAEELERDPVRSAFGQLTNLRRSSIRIHDFDLILQPLWSSTGARRSEHVS